jgi:hypothetical protein
MIQAGRAPREDSNRLTDARRHPGTGNRRSAGVHHRSVEQWLRGSSVEDAQKMQKPAPDDAVVIRPEEKKAA